jgi:hypothetical protein
LTGGYHLAFGVGAGLVATAVVLALAVLRPRARPGTHVGGKIRWSRAARRAMV